MGGRARGSIWLLHVAVVCGMLRHATAMYVKVDGESCIAEGYADIYDLDECTAARDELGFPEHDSVIRDEDLPNRPHGCTVQNDGLIRLYMSGTQDCTDPLSGLDYCLCINGANCGAGQSSGSGASSCSNCGAGKKSSSGGISPTV